MCGKWLGPAQSACLLVAAAGCNMCCALGTNPGCLHVQYVCVIRWHMSKLMWQVDMPGCGAFAVLTSASIIWPVRRVQPHPLSVVQPEVPRAGKSRRYVNHKRELKSASSISRICTRQTAAAAFRQRCYHKSATVRRITPAMLLTRSMRCAGCPG
jgi:hypothetical protein